MEVNTAISTYKTRLFSNEDRKEIDRYFLYVNELLKKSSIDFSLENSLETPIDLQSVTLIDLKSIQDLNKVLKSLALISYKIESCIEYKNIHRLINEAKTLIELMEKKVNELSNELTKNYSLYAKNHVSFEEVIPFSEFKAFFQKIYSSNTLTMNQLNYFDDNKLFDQIKVNLIAEKTKMLDIINSNQHTIINLAELSENKVILGYLQREFFYSLCKNEFNLSIMYGKTAHAEIISPSHQLATSLNLAKKEIGLLTLSLNPINKALMNINDKFDYKNMTFEVSSVQDTVKIDYFHQLKLNKTTVINLQLPIYFSFIRCQIKNF